MRVSAAGGEAHALTAPDERNEFGHTGPWVQPGRDEIFFTIVPNAATDLEMVAGAQIAVYHPHKSCLVSVEGLALIFRQENNREKKKG